MYRNERLVVARGLGKDGVESERSLRQDSCIDDKVLYGDYIDVSILDGVVYCSFARYYHWEKVSKS